MCGDITLALTLQSTQQNSGMFSNCVCSARHWPSLVVATRLPSRRADCVPFRQRARYQPSSVGSRYANVAPGVGLGIRKHLWWDIRGSSCRPETESNVFISIDYFDSWIRHHSGRPEYIVIVYNFQKYGDHFRQCNLHDSFVPVENISQQSIVLVLKVRMHR